MVSTTCSVGLCQSLSENRNHSTQISQRLTHHWSNELNEHHLHCLLLLPSSINEYVLHANSNGFTFTQHMPSDRNILQWIPNAMRHSSGWRLVAPSFLWRCQYINKIITPCDLNTPDSLISFFIVRGCSEAMKLQSSEQRINVYLILLTKWHWSLWPKHRIRDLFNGGLGTLNKMAQLVVLILFIRFDAILFTVVKWETLAPWSLPPISMPHCMFSIYCCCLTMLDHGKDSPISPKQPWRLVNRQQTRSTKMHFVGGINLQSKTTANMAVAW